jgi:hypothetical protein
MLNHCTNSRLLSLEYPLPSIGNANKKGDFHSGQKKKQRHAQMMLMRIILDV